MDLDLAGSSTQNIDDIMNGSVSNVKLCQFTMKDTKE